jgi:prephenate dehydrogenase
VSRTVAVIGLGLIGGSMSAALRHADRHVRGFDLSPARSESALARGLVSEVGANLPSIVEGAGVIILAVPVLRILDLLPRVDALSSPQALILDVGSVKRPIVDLMGSLPGGERMVGGHPLAGKSESGPAAAEPRLFRGARFFLTPSPRTSADTVAEAQEVVRAVEALPVVVDASSHDRAVAATSHLPQVLSSVLAQAPVERDFVGPGYRDMTRLASSDVTVWRDILLTNADQIAAAGRDFAGRFDRVLTAIEGGDVAAIEEMLLAGRGGTRHLDEAPA